MGFFCLKVLCLMFLHFHLVTNPATKMSQVKKQSLTRVEPLPVAKRKKMGKN